MAKSPRISEAEWELMEVLWQRHPLTAAELITLLPEERNWAPNTIRTMLARLVKKGALAAEPRGGSYLYTPLVARDQCVGEEVDSMMDRVFGGSLFPLLMHFAERRKLKPEQLRELRNLLKDEEEGK